MHAKTQLDGWVEQIEFERDNEEMIAAKAAEEVPELICYHCDASVPITEVNDHWRTCPKSPSRAEIERLRAANTQMRDVVDAEEGRLRDENDRLRKALRQISNRTHTMRGTSMGTNRQERRIWQGMGEIADRALGVDSLTGVDPTV